MPESCDGSATTETGEAVHPATALVLQYAERDRQRREQQPTSPTPTEKRVPGEDAIVRRLRLGGVPPEYQTGEWDRVRAPGVRRVADEIEERCLKTGAGALFLGGPGVGKSTAAGLVCRAAVTAGLTVRYAYLPVLMDEMLNHRERLAIVRLQSRVDLLVWDDLGVRSLADWEIGFMDEIVETRYQRRKPMIVTGNLTADDLKADERMARMVDRWRQRTAYSAIAFGGKSMR